jgi:hypothetical protein
MLQSLLDVEFHGFCDAVLPLMLSSLLVIEFLLVLRRRAFAEVDEVAKVAKFFRVWDGVPLS